MKKFLSLMLVLVLVVGLTPSVGAAKSKAAKKPARVTKVKLSNPIVTGKTTNAMTLSWKKAKKAKSYQVYIYKSKWKKYKKKKGVSVEVGKLAYGKKYKFKVRGINGKKKGKFSKAVSITVLKDGQMIIKDYRGKKQVKPQGEGYKLVMLAKKHVGKGYKPGGRYLRDPGKKGDKNKLDCTGFVQEIFLRYAGISLPSGSHKKMIKAALKIGKDIKSMEAAQMGDIVFYKLGKKNNLQHVAICAGNGKIIDASRGLGGVFVHDQYNKKPVRIVRVLRSGGDRQVLTQEERNELAIEKIDKSFKQFYRKAGKTVPGQNYTFLNLYKKNKSIIETATSYTGGQISFVLTTKAEKNRAAYLEKLVLPSEPPLETDGKGNVKLTGDVENYYRMLIGLAGLSTGEYQMRYVADDYNRINSITKKDGEVFVNISYNNTTNRQIVFRGTMPVRSYAGCKEGDKFIVINSSNAGTAVYPMLADSRSLYKDDEYSDSYYIGMGMAVWEIGKPVPYFYDEDGNLDEVFQHQGFRTASPNCDGSNDGSVRIGVWTYEDASHNDTKDYYEFEVKKFDEKILKDGYSDLKERYGKKYVCVDGTVIDSYEKFKEMCITGMKPYTAQMQKLLESISQKEGGYFGKFN